MSTDMELISQYFNRIMSAQNKELETKKIIKEIDSLVYTYNREIISDNDKKNILQKLLEKFQESLYKQFDNKEYLTLISMAIEYLNNNSK